MGESEKVERKYNFKVLPKSKTPKEPTDDPEFGIWVWSTEFLQNALIIICAIVIWNDCTPKSGAPRILIWIREIMVVIWDFIYYTILDNEELMWASLWCLEVAFFLWIWRGRMEDVKKRLVEKAPGPFYGACHWIPWYICHYLTCINLVGDNDEAYIYKEDTCVRCATSLMCIDTTETKRDNKTLRHKQLGEMYYPKIYPHVDAQKTPEEDDWKSALAVEEEFRK